MSQLKNIALGLIAAGIIVALLAGCASPVAPPEASGNSSASPTLVAGQGSVRVSLGGTNARTLTPVAQQDFTKYSLVFTSDAGASVTRDIDPTVEGASEIAVPLQAGSWTLAVTGYTSPAGYSGFCPSASGTRTFVLAAGDETQLDVTITPSATPTAAADGMFRYTIGYPASLVSGTMRLVPRDGDELPVIPLELGGTATATIALPPGVYDLFINLSMAVGSAGPNYQPIAGRYAAVYIYSGLLTEAAAAAFTFVDADFCDAVYLSGLVELAIPTGMTVTEVSVKAYSDETTHTTATLIVSGGVATLDGLAVTSTSPSATGSAATPDVPWAFTIPLSATEGAFWLVVTVSDATGPVTTEVFEQDAGTIHRQGNVLTLSVTVEQGSELCFTTVDEFVAWLDAQPSGNTPPAAPYSAKFSLDDLSEYENICAALGEDKYVVLDFSESTGTTISANASTPNKNKIVSVILPDSVETIGAYAFQNCTSLTTIDLPARVTRIPDNAFRGCSSLESIDLPATLTRIGDFTFYECTALTTVTLNRTDTVLTTLDTTSVFENCDPNLTIYVPSARVTDYQSAPNWSSYTIQALP